MKLDIEALAREAGFITGSRDLFIPGQSVRFIKPIGGEGCGPELGRLARLIVERCAAECENYAIKSAFDGEPENDHEGAATYLADKLRQLLEDNHGNTN